MKSKSSLLSHLTCFLFLLALSPVPCALSQVPQGLNYQAVAHSNTGAPIANTMIQVKAGILSDTLKPVIIWEEVHSSVKTNTNGVFSLVIGSGIKQAGSASAFSDIDWAMSPLYLKIQINYQGTWRYLGSAKLWSVPYSLIAGDLDGAVERLEVVGEDVTSDEALFEVKRKDGKTMFAVYNHGVRVFMPLDTISKTRKGGFVIGGFDATKGVVQDYFVVNPDSIRAYIDTNPEKTRKGGFAIGSFNQVKGVIQEYLTVSSDSVRVYINETDAKTRKGGFAVGGFNDAKGLTNEYFNISGKSESDIITGEPRVMWYPRKEAFMAGNVIVESEDSVGTNSWASGYRSKAIGDWSQALGYKAVARGDYSTAIGREAVAWKENSFAFGQFAQAKNTESYAFGRGALATGYRSFAFGSAGIDSAGTITGAAYAKGDYSFAIGQGSRSPGIGSVALGLGDTARGNYSVAIGYKTMAFGYGSTAMGKETKASGYYSTAMGLETTASGSESTAMGQETIASGIGSTAMGAWTKATSWFSTAIGCSSVASGPMSTAIGNSTTASGQNSIAMGWYSKAVGENSFAIHMSKGNLVAPSVGADIFRISGADEIGGNVGWKTYSDRRLKKDIEDLNIENNLEKIMKLNGVRFKWIDNDFYPNLGLIAQDVLDVLPEVVKYDNLNDIYLLEYTAIIPVLIEGIKQQQQQIESQNEKIAGLEKMILEMKGGIASSSR